MIHEDAGQLVADGLVDQHRGHGGIDTAGQAADHLAIAHLLADFGNLGRAEFGHRPIARQPADMAREIGQQLAAVGGMDDLGMELGAVELAAFVGDHREGRTIAGGDDFETHRQIA